jgi:hypothetical protein
MASREHENATKLPHSPGNEGARGSHGAANRGARAEDSTNDGGRDAQLPDEGKEDLRNDPNAQGGGGIASGSSRSADK